MKFNSIISRGLLVAGMFIYGMSMHAQYVPTDSIKESILVILLLLRFLIHRISMLNKKALLTPDDEGKLSSVVRKDSLKMMKKGRDWSKWRPNPKRALWLAIVLPGAGQVYNRKYWKLPIFYGGFVGCIYAMTWNNQMYHDYAQAYIDIMDNDPTRRVIITSFI